MADNSLTVKFTADLREFSSGVASAKSQIAGFVDSISSITDVLPQIAGGLAAAFAVDKIVDFAKSMAQMGSQTLRTAQMLGLSTEAVSTLGAGFASIGLPADTATNMLERLERNMVEAQREASGPAAAAFKAVGISLGELKTLSPEQVLNRLADAFSKTADGPNKTAVAMALMGRAGAEMIPLLDKGRAGLEEFRTVAVETGTILSARMASALDATSTKMSTLNLAVEGLGVNMFQNFEGFVDRATDRLTRFIEKLTAAASTSASLKNIESLRSQIESVGGELGKAKAQAAEAAKSQDQLLHELAKATSPPMGHPGAGSIDLSKAFPEGAIETPKLVAKEAQTATNRIADLTAKLASLQDQLKAAEASAASSPASGGGKAQMAAMQASSGADIYLAKLREITATARQGSAERVAAAQYELSYVTAKYGAWSVEAISAEKSVTEAKQQEVQLRRSLSEDEANTDLAVAKSRIESSKSSLDAEVAANQITATQKVEILRALTAQEYELDLKRLQDELATLDKGTLEYQRVFDQIRLLKEKSVADQAALDRQAADAAKEQLDKQKQDSDEFFGTVGSSFKSFIGEVISGHESISEADIQAIDKMAEEWIEKIAEMLAQWAAFQAATGLFGTGSSIAKLIGDPFASGAGGLGGLLGSLIGGGGAGGAIESAGAIAMFAAEGLWSVPADNTPVTTHAGEMILPASISAGVRAGGSRAFMALSEWGIPNLQAARISQAGAPTNLQNLGTSAAALSAASNSGGGSRSSGEGGGVTFAPQVSAVDAKSVVALFNNPSIMRQFAKNLGGYMKNNTSARPAY